MLKKSKNLEEKKSPQKSLFSKNMKILKISFFCRKNAIPLVLPIEEISLRPELFSPARSRIQGGYPERDTAGVVVAGRYFPFLFWILIHTTTLVFSTR